MYVNVDFISNNIPKINLQIEKLIQNEILNNFHFIKDIKDVSEGGIGVTLCELSLQNNIGHRSKPLKLRGTIHSAMSKSWNSQRAKLHLQYL